MDSSAMNQDIIKYEKQFTFIEKIMNQLSDDLVKPNSCKSKDQISTYTD